MDPRAMHAFHILLLRHYIQQTQIQFRLISSLYLASQQTAWSRGLHGNRVWRRGGAFRQA